MDNYCRTCMRDSNKFSPIFEEMTYGGISLQEAIEDVCQLEISIGDDLPLYVCRDCALKLYDIVKFKTDAHQVYSALRKLKANIPRTNGETDEPMEEVIRPRIKREIDESIEQTSLFSPETENIKVEEFCGSHSIEDSDNSVTAPFGTTTNSDAGNSNFEPTQSSVMEEHRIRGTDSFEDSDNSVTDPFGTTTNSDAGNANFEHPQSSVMEEHRIRGTDSFEDSDNSVTAPFGTTTNSDAGNANFEPTQSSVMEEHRIRGTDSFEDSDSSVTAPFGTTTNSDAGNANFEPTQSSVMEEHRIRGTDSFEDSDNTVTAPILTTTNSDAGNAKFEHPQSSVMEEHRSRGTDSFELPSILAVESGTLKVTESRVNDYCREEIFRRNTQRIAEGKGNPCSQTFYPNVKELNEVQIEERKRDSKDVSLPSFNRQISIFDDKAEGKGNLTRRENYCQSEGTHLQPERTEDNETAERESVDNNSIVKEGEVEHDDATSNPSNTTAIVGLDTCIPTEVESHICHVCDKCFYKKSLLKKHERIHHVVKQFECEICSRKFRMEYSFKRHQKTHELFRKSLRSDDGNGIKASCSSELHKEGSTEELDKLPIQADDKEREDIGKNATILIDSNVPRHEGESIDHAKILICDCCGKEFWNKNALLEHLILHNGRRSSSKCLLPEVRKTTKIVCVDSNRINERGWNVSNRNEEEDVALRSKTYVKKSVVDSVLKIPEMVRKNNPREEPFACRYCRKIFQTTSDRKKHELNHTRDKPFACHYCSKMFSRSFVRNRHELIHTGEKPFSCQYCSKAFNTIGNLKRHELIHSGEKPFSCQYCSKLFSKKSYLRKHEIVHSEDKPFACQYCSKTFSRAYVRKLHELIHTGEKPFSCQYCSKMFRKSSDQKRHELIHLRGKALACQYCSKLFSSTSNRKMHELNHSGGKTFACKYCSKLFQRKYALKKHELIRHGKKPFVCKYCSKMFTKTSVRKQHELIHTGEKPFVCPYCSKCFRKKSILNAHELIHSTEEPFSCKYCPKIFKRKDVLKRHELIHSGEKPFACKYCSRTFTRQYQRIKHERIHSGQKPFA